MVKGRGKTLRLLLILARWLLLVQGSLFTLLLLFCFTSGPFWIYHWLGTSLAGKTTNPEWIVVLGGGGMPSESGLIRCYHAATMARYYPEANIIIALPGKPDDSTSSVFLMKKELVLRGIDPRRIVCESDGVNTRSQAVNVTKIISPPYCETAVCLVTSPEHMRRAVKVFKKAGMLKTTGYPAFEQAIEVNVVFEQQELGGRQLPIPDVGRNINVRYRFWTHLRYMSLIVKEFIALGYYQAKGWI